MAQDVKRRVQSNRLRELFEGDDTVMAMLIGIPTPAIVDLAACSGFDYVMLDTEHCTYGLDTLSQMVSAAQGRGIGTLVRLYGPDQYMIAKVLDIGVDGVKFSKVATRQDAEDIVRYCKLPPLGDRSPEPATRSGMYGMLDREEYDRAANDTVVVVGVDTREGLRNVEDIVSVPGLDAVQIGPSDLSWSLGVSKESQEFIDAVQVITRAAQAAGLTPIRAVYTPEQIGEWLERDPSLRVFQWAADRMNISRFFCDGIDRGKQIALDFSKRS